MPNDNSSDQLGQLLRSAAAKLPASIDLSAFYDHLGRDELHQAWEALRDTAAEHAVPFGFWVEMSKAADLLGGP